MTKKRKIGSYLSKHYKKLWFIFLLAVLFSTAFRYLRFLPLIGDLEDKTLDYRFRLTPLPEKADSNVVLVAIDDKSLKFVRELENGWPFPREYYALVSRYLQTQGAASIIYDMQFYEPDFDRVGLDSEESDNDFASAMQESGKVIIGAQLIPESTAVSPFLQLYSIRTEEVSGLKQQSWKGIEAPIDIFLQNCAGVGIINIGAEREAIIRRMPLFAELQGGLYPNLALAAWLRNNPSPNPPHINSREFSIDGKNIPISSTGAYTINWYGKGDVDGVFRYYSFAAVLQSAAATFYQGIPSLAPDTFRGKHVIIGAKAAGLMDLKSTPYTWSVPGMEIWATILSNLNRQDFVRHAPFWANWLICFLLVFLILLAVTRLKGGLATVLLVATLLLFLAGSVLLFQTQRLVIDLTVPLLSFIATWIFIVTVSYLMEGKHKKELRLIFTRYLHPDLVQRIVDQPDMVQMGGDEYQATVMFSDIYNFTGFSENKTPTELVSYLNEYFSSFTNTILDCKGLLDKYTGDGLMAVWGVPIAREDHALLACKAALAHREFSRKFATQIELKPSQNFHLNTRLGIHSGHIVAGNIGSERRMEYTSIGDTVNLSSRLEGVNKVFRTHIIISEATQLLVKDQMVCRELDFLRVKGKTEPTRIFELVADRETAGDTDFGWIADYENALELYRRGDWSAAADIFTRLSALPLEDKAAETMLHRCHYLIANPPAEWDGILTMEEK